MTTEFLNGYLGSLEGRNESQYFLFPVCERCEYSWLVNLVEGTISDHIMTITDGKSAVPLKVIKKEEGEKTLLIMEEPFAGFVAADLNDSWQLGALHENWKITEYPEADGFILRPLMSDFRMGLSDYSQALIRVLIASIFDRFEKIPDNIKEVLSEWQNKNYTDALVVVDWLLKARYPDFPTDIMLANSRKFLERLKSME
jgi:hypothetical protein